MTNKSFVGEPIGGFIFVNPGTGPIEKADFLNATKNMEYFARDVGDDVNWTRGLHDLGDGRFQFSMWRKGFENDAILIEMPGLPLEEVRYMKTEGQNIWNFPRLYVEGSSWVWHYAIGTAKDKLFGESE